MGAMVQLLLGMVVCFACGIFFGAAFGVALLGIAVSWAVLFSARHPLQTRSARRTSGVLLLVTALVAFIWGMRHHGSFRPPRSPGEVRMMATGTAYVWRNATALIDDGKGAVLASFESAELLSLGSANGITPRIHLRHCGAGAWLRPSSCDARPGRQRDPWRSSLKALRRRAVLYLDSFGPVSGAWFKALLLGISSNERGGLLDAFRATGLLHFIVVSGSHVTLMQRLFSAFFSVPLIALRALFPALSSIAMNGTRLAAVFATIPVAAFCLVAGLDPPVQRAICSLIVMQLVAVAGLSMGPASMMASTFMIQAVFWPVGFASRSNMLSWISWSIVVLVRPFLRGTPSIATACLRQSLLMVAMASFFGISCSAGIIANLVFLPVLEVFFVASVVVCALGPDFAGVIGFERLVTTITGLARRGSLVAGVPGFAQIDSILATPGTRIFLMTLVWAAFSAYAASTLVASAGKVDVPPCIADCGR